MNTRIPSFGRPSHSRIDVVHPQHGTTLFVGALVLALVAATASSVATARAPDASADGAPSPEQTDAILEATAERERAIRDGNWSIGSTSRVGSLIAGRASEFWLDGPAESGGSAMTAVEWDLGAPDAVGMRTTTTAVLGTSEAPAVSHVYEQADTVVVSATLVFDVPLGAATPRPVVAACALAVEATPPVDGAPENGSAWSDPLDCPPPLRPVCRAGDTLVAPVFDTESGELRDPVRCQGPEVVLPPQRITVEIERVFDVVSIHTIGTADDPRGDGIGGADVTSAPGASVGAGSISLDDLDWTNPQNTSAVDLANQDGAAGGPSTQVGSVAGQATSQAPMSPIGSPVVPGLWRIAAPDPRGSRPRLVVGTRSIDLDDLELLGWTRSADDAVEPGPLDLGLDALIGETILGDWSDDNITLFGETRDAVVRLGAGQDRLVVFESSVFDTLVDLADGNDTLTVTNATIEGSTILLGSGGDTLDMVGQIRTSAISQSDGAATLTVMGAFVDSTIDLGGDQDSLFVAGEVTGSRLLLGAGNDSLALVAATRKSTVELGDGDDEMLLDSEVSGLVVDLGAGMDTVALGETFRGDVIINDPARSTVKSNGSNLRDNDRVVLAGDGWVRRDGDSSYPTFVRLVNDSVVARIVLGSENVEVVATTTGDVLLERQPERKRRGFFGRLLGGLVKVFKFAAPIVAVLFPPAAALIGVATGILGLVEGVAAGCVLCAIGAAASFVPGVGPIVTKGVNLIRNALDNNLVRGISSLFNPLVAKIGSAVENIVDSKPVAAIVDAASAIGSAVGGAGGRTIDLVGQGFGKAADLFSGGAKAWYALTTWAIGAGRQLEAIDAEQARVERLARLAEIDPLTRRLERARAKTDRSAIPAGETLFLDGSTSDLVAPVTPGLVAQALGEPPVPPPTPPVPGYPPFMPRDAPALRFDGELIRNEQAAIRQRRVAEAQMMSRYLVERSTGDVGRRAGDGEPAASEYERVPGGPFDQYEQRTSGYERVPGGPFDQYEQRMGGYERVPGGPIDQFEQTLDWLNDGADPGRVAALDPATQEYISALRSSLAGFDPADFPGIFDESGLTRWADVESGAVSSEPFSPNDRLMTFLDLYQQPTPKGEGNRLRDALVFAAFGSVAETILWTGQQPDTIPYGQRMVNAVPIVGRGAISNVVLGGGLPNIETGNVWTDFLANTSKNVAIQQGLQVLSRRALNPAIERLGMAGRTDALFGLGYVPPPAGAEASFRWGMTNFTEMTPAQQKSIIRKSDLTVAQVNTLVPLLVTAQRQGLRAFGLDGNFYTDLASESLAIGTGVALPIWYANGQFPRAWGGLGVRPDWEPFVLPTASNFAAKFVLTKGIEMLPEVSQNQIRSICTDANPIAGSIKAVACDLFVELVIDTMLGGGPPPPPPPGGSVGMINISPLAGTPVAPLGPLTGLTAVTRDGRPSGAVEWSSGATRDTPAPSTGSSPAPSRPTAIVEPPVAQPGSTRVSASGEMQQLVGELALIGDGAGARGSVLEFRAPDGSGELVFRSPRTEYDNGTTDVFLYRSSGTRVGYNPLGEVTEVRRLSPGERAELSGYTVTTVRTASVTYDLVGDGSPSTRPGRAVFAPTGDPAMEEVTVYPAERIDRDGTLTRFVERPRGLDIDLEAGAYMYLVPVGTPFEMVEVVTPPGPVYASLPVYAPQPVPAPSPTPAAMPSTSAAPPTPPRQTAQPVEQPADRPSRQSESPGWAIASKRPGFGEARGVLEAFGNGVERVTGLGIDFWNIDFENGRAGTYRPDGTRIDGPGPEQIPWLILLTTPIEGSTPLLPGAAPGGVLVPAF